MLFSFVRYGNLDTAEESRRSKNPRIYWSDKVTNVAVLRRIYRQKTRGDE